MPKESVTTGDSKEKPMTFTFTKSGKWINPETVDQRYNVRDIKEKKRLEAKERL